VSDDPVAELVAWWRHVLDEDEQTARDLGGESWEAGIRCITAPALTGPSGERRIVSQVSRGALADWAAEHDPARELREIEANRAVICLWEAARDIERTTPDVPGLVAVRLAYEQVIRRLARADHDRPGYREEWRP
jgi:hypothetical protein